MNNDTKICPYCGQEIKAIAKKCRFCGKWLDEDDRGDNNKPQKQQKINSQNEAINRIIKDKNKDEKQTNKYIIFILIFMFLPAIIFILIKPVLPKMKNFDHQSKQNSNLTNNFMNENDNDIIFEKQDYLGSWSNGRAILEFTDKGDHIKFTAKWASSAVSSAYWEFDCTYIDKQGYLSCRNGIDVETIPTCNGIEYKDAGSFGICQKKYPETVKITKKRIYNDARGEFRIKKGDYKECNPFLQYGKDIVLNFRNNSYNFDSLEQTCFAKYKDSSEIVNYSDVLNQVEKFQSEYWEIVKRHDLFFYFGEENLAIAKDMDDLSDLFQLVELSINKDSHYYTKLKNIEERFKNNPGETTYEAKQFEQQYIEAIDSLLNEIYKDIRATIPADDFEKLKRSEIRWLNDIENYRKIYEMQDHGTIGGLLYANFLNSIRKFRILLLMFYIK